ncbi:MAG: hypothetical protein J5700_00500, partial [Treponema sp.]|nr:hypothetical protein [Treponema sp.]
SAAGRIRNGAGAFINDATQGTVEFTSPSGADDLASVDYFNLTINGSGTYEANEDLTVNNDLKVLAGTAKFNNSASDDTTTAATAAFSTGTTISLGNNEGDKFTVGGTLNLPSDLAGLSLAGTITAGGTGISLGHNATLNDNTIFASATKTTGDITLTGAFTVTNTATATLDTTSGVLTLENASLTNTGTVTKGNIIFTGTSNQTFAPNVDSTYDSVKISKETDGSVTVNKAFSTKELAIKQASGKNTKFDAKATVSDSFSDTGNKGNILFNKGCAFTSTTTPTTFATTGRVTLNGSTSATATCAFTAGVTHIAGPTTLYGALNTTNSDITLGTTTLAADTTINAGTGAVKINGTLNGTFAFTSSGSGSLTFAGAVGATAAPTTITVAGPTNVKAASITTTGLQLYKGDLTFDTTACAVTGVVQAAANVTANSGATFKNNLWIYTASAPATPNDSTLAGTASITVEKNLFFAKDGKKVDVNTSVTAQNILLLHGTLNVNVALTSTQDIIWLGSAYSIADSATGASGVTNLFAYKHDSRKCQASYTDAFPTACPDGTIIASPYTGAVNVAGDVTVTAGQNFYANGLDITGSGAWTLKLKDNNKQTDAFAELYNSTITNCTASPITGSNP